MAFPFEQWSQRLLATSCPPATNACGISMEPGGKGSFQAAKLQRSDRTTVCSHSTGDVAAMRSIASTIIITTIRISVCAIADSWEAKPNARAISLQDA
jgi:hypothetical protein